MTILFRLLAIFKAGCQSEKLKKKENCFMNIKNNFVV